MTPRYGILTVSDRSARGEREDLSGPALEAAVIAQNGMVSRRGVVPDEYNAIKTALLEWAQDGELDVILTTGGTGFAPRDITPEATLAVIERQAMGLVEAARAASLLVTPHAMLSRGVAGIYRRTLIVNLPGSPKGAVEHYLVIAPVIPHAAALLRNDPESEEGHRRVG